jgi:hypothetical protein
MISPFFTRRRGAIGGVSLISLVVLAWQPLPAWSSAGQEGASFLEMPVGAGPASLGSAYTALANDAYAPVWNPAGLGFLDSTQISAMHQTYFEDTSFEYLSVVHPLRPGRALGVSAHYFRPGDLDRTDSAGNVVGTFSGYYAAYALSYGQKVGDDWSLGLTGKMISAKIADVTATAYAGDAGIFYRPAEKWTLAAVAANIGTDLKFLNQSDALPQEARAGAAYNMTGHVTVSGEGAFHKQGPVNGRAGIQWLQLTEDDSSYAIRAGYSTDRMRGLSTLAGLSLGLGITVWHHELAYAWMPLGDFGSTHFFSLTIRFGVPRSGHLSTDDESHYNLIDDQFGGGDSLLKDLNFNDSYKSINE